MSYFSGKLAKQMASVSTAGRHFWHHVRPLKPKNFQAIFGLKLSGAHAVLFVCGINAGPQLNNFLLSSRCSLDDYLAYWVYEKIISEKNDLHCSTIGFYFLHKNVSFF